MAPTSTVITGFFRQVIHYHLDNNLWDNALFFAERLTAQDPRSSESAHLLSLCHLRLGDARSAYEVSKPAGYRGINLGCAWVFGQACLLLERYKDGITALEKSRGLWTQKSNIGLHSATSRATYPDAAAVLCLLGKLYRAYDDRKKAVSCFEEALRINPFMWDAFTALCDMGATVRVPNIFKLNESVAQNFEQELLMAAEHKEGNLASSLELSQKVPPARAVSENPFELHRSSTYQDMPFGSNVFSIETEKNELMSKINAATRPRFAAINNGSSQGADSMETTPTGHHSSIISQIPPSVFHAEPPQAPTRTKRTAQTVESGFLDAPPRMTYRLGSKEPARPAKRDQEQGSEAAPETGGPTAQTTRSSAIPSMDRKRTASGHPITRTAVSDDAVPRRSTRINMFKSTKSTSSGAATIGAAASRELKKARPQISRLIRPGSSGSSVGRVVSGNRKPPPEEHGGDVDHGETARVRSHPSQSTGPLKVVASVEQSGAGKTEEALRWILELLRKLGTGYYQASQFQCQEALEVYGSLAKAQQDTPWVLAQIGRAHYELANYVEAEKVFRRVRILAPTRLEDMEVYSTILWFLKRETDLSFLAHELIDASWHSPQAWCALGNAWSLARDHEQALRCFRRATQLDPGFAYAFTLQGHEHVANEEYERALTAYRAAVAADRRHYNAYYGIGRVYERLGSYDKAHAHYAAASDINPTNAVLVCCVGTVLEKQKQMMAALQYYTRATELAPKAAQTRYKKARAMLAVGQYEQAHRELMMLKDMAPDEATVQFLLGKLFKQLGDRGLSVRHFSNALALDPKASQQIKEAIETFEDEVQMDDSMM